MILMIISKSSKNKSTYSSAINITYCNILTGYIKAFLSISLLLSSLSISLLLSSLSISLLLASLSISLLLSPLSIFSTFFFNLLYLFLSRNLYYYFIDFYFSQSFLFLTFFLFSFLLQTSFLLFLDTSVSL